jgi:hypothetical protein
VSLPYWTGWCLGLTPGRVVPLAGPPPTAAAPEEDADPRPFRKKCMYCRTFFTGQDTYIQHGYQDCRAKVLPMVILWDFVNASAPKRRRKCSPFQRARSRNFSKSIKRREEKAAAEAGQGMLLRTRALYERNPNLPLDRGQCKEGPRPCAILSCRHHQAFTVNAENGSVKENFPHLRIWADPEGAGLHALEAMHGTCGLDLADKAMARTRSTWADDAPGTAGLVALAHLAKSGKPIGNTTAFTLEEVAKVLGLSLERVRQLGAIALKEVRVALRRMESARPGVRRA